MSPRVTILTLLVTAGCVTETGVARQKRYLSTEQATFDAGVVAVADRETMTVYLASSGSSPVKVYDIYLEDEADAEVWHILDTWAEDDSDDDGTADQLEIPAGSESDPTYAPVQVSFRPKTSGYYRTTMIIESNDDGLKETVEVDGQTRSIWKVVLRGVARYPCGSLYPTFLDFGPRPAGGYYSQNVTIENCGNVTLTVADFDSKSNAFTVDTTVPLYVIPGSTETFTVGWVPKGSDSESTDITLDTNIPDFDEVVDAIGNDCESSVDDAWDGDDDGWFECGGDCDDSDPDINPGAKETADDGIDSDCDGGGNEGAKWAQDEDGDGVTKEDGDCDDQNDAVYPGADEDANNIDDDCDGTTDEKTSRYDDDGDGYSEREGDCDDQDSAIYPGAVEDSNDVDDDCDGDVDENSFSFDDDEDGWAEIEDGSSNGDCDDDDPWTYPDAQEDCDEVDNDCDGVVDEGEDGTEDGACAFLVQRDETTFTDSGSESSCATVPVASGTATLVLAGLAALGLRRRED